MLFVNRFSTYIHKLSATVCAIHCLPPWVFMAIVTQTDANNHNVLAEACTRHHRLHGFDQRFIHATHGGVELCVALEGQRRRAVLAGESCESGVAGGNRTPEHSVCSGRPYRSATATLILGGHDENRTHHTVLARHSRPLGTCVPKNSFPWHGVNLNQSAHSRCHRGATC